MAQDSSAIEREMMRRLMTAVAKEINITKMAKTLAPKIQKKMAKSIVEAFEAKNMGDFIYDCLDKKFYTAVNKVLTRAVAKVK